VLALDVETGATRWTHELKAAHRVMIAPGGTLIAVTTNAVHALSAADGTPLWSAQVPGDPMSAPVVAGKWLLVAAGEGGLRWLEAASGRVLRVFDPGSGVSGPPGVSGGRVYVLSNAGVLFALDLT
jgi:outer membrane protein assembly factor BamB